jgi:hypothetical protein
MRYFFNFFVFSFLLIAGCSGSVFNMPAIDAAVADFKVKYDSNDYRLIYDQSAQGMRSAVTEEDLVKTLTAVKTVLGNIVEYKQTSVLGAKSAAGDDLVVARYQTTFEHGVGEQIYFLAAADNGYLLYQWNINSNDLIKGMVNKVN